MDPSGTSPIHPIKNVAFAESERQRNNDFDELIAEGKVTEDIIDEESESHYEEEVIEDDDEEHRDFLHSENSHSVIAKPSWWWTARENSESYLSRYEEDCPEDEDPIQPSLLSISLKGKLQYPRTPEHKPNKINRCDPEAPILTQQGGTPLQTTIPSNFPTEISTKLDPKTVADDPPQTLIIQAFNPRKYSSYSIDEFSDISDILSSSEQKRGKLSIKDDASEISGSFSYKERITAIVKKVTRPEQQLILTPEGGRPAEKKRKGQGEQELRKDPEDGTIEQTLDSASSSTLEEKSKYRSTYLLLFFFLVVFVVCATVYLVLYLLHITQTGDHKWKNIADGNVTQGVASDFVGAQPTTSMDPYKSGCDFGLNYTQPHVLQQCSCWGKIAVIAPDVKEKYYALNMKFIELKVAGDWEFTEESCDPRNQALVWLATTYARDSSDMVQKYALASFYFTTKGEQWISQGLWLDYLDICFWKGVICSKSGSVTSLNLDSNGLEGTVSKDGFIASEVKAVRRSSFFVSCTHHNTTDP